MSSLAHTLINSAALVTGASKGIGWAISQELMRNGIAVTGVARTFTKHNKLDSDVNSAIDSRLFSQWPADLSDIDALAEKLSTLPANIGTLVLNAGYGQFGGLEQFSVPQIRQLIDTNLVSNLILTKHYLPLMKQAGGGDIVIIGSESALQGGKAGSVYCASKFALRGFAQSLRADCSTANVRVHMINPGPVNSDFFSTLNFAPQSGEEFSLQPQDIAQAVLYALSQPRNVVNEEICVQPMKRSFKKK